MVRTVLVRVAGLVLAVLFVVTTLGCGGEPPGATSTGKGGGPIMGPAAGPTKASTDKEK